MSDRKDAVPADDERFEAAGELSQRVDSALPSQRADTLDRWRGNLQELDNKVKVFCSPIALQLNDVKYRIDLVSDNERFQRQMRALVYYAVVRGLSHLPLFGYLE